MPAASKDFGCLIVDGDVWLIVSAIGPITDDHDRAYQVFLDRQRRTVYVDESLSARDVAIAVAQVSNLLHGRRERRRSNPAARLCFN